MVNPRINSRNFCLLLPTWDAFKWTPNGLLLGYLIIACKPHYPLGINHGHGTSTVHFDDFPIKTCSYMGFSYYIFPHYFPIKQRFLPWWLQRVAYFEPKSCFIFASRQVTSLLSQPREERLANLERFTSEMPRFLATFLMVGSGISLAKHDDLTIKNRDWTRQTWWFNRQKSGYHQPQRIVCCMGTRVLPPNFEAFNEMILLVAQEPGVSIFLMGLPNGVSFFLWTN